VRREEISLPKGAARRVRLGFKGSTGIYEPDKGRAAGERIARDSYAGRRRPIGRGHHDGRPSRRMKAEKKISFARGRAAKGRKY